MSLVDYDIDTKQLDALARVFADVRDIVASTIEQVTADVAPSILDVARNYPRPAVHPFVWSNDPIANRRAQRYYHAAIARGEISTNGSRYVRTNKFANGFDVRVEESSNSTDAVLGNNFDKSTYIVGSADGSVNQIVGHDRTGWNPFRNVAQQFENDIVQGVDRALPNAIEKRISDAS